MAKKRIIKDEGKTRIWKVDFTPEFLTQLDELPDDVRKEIHEAIKKLSESEHPEKLGKKLTKKEVKKYLESKWT